MTDMTDKKKKNEEKSRFPRWAIILIVLAVFVFCVLPIGGIAILTIMGPTVGNVFSEIVVTLEAELAVTEVGYNIVDPWLEGLGSTPEPFGLP